MNDSQACSARGDRLAGKMPRSFLWHLFGPGKKNPLMISVADEIPTSGEVE